MNKKGFTLVELLVVISIISILSLLVIPSIININKNVDSRLYGQKIEYILSAAQLYGSNNPDIFVGSNTVKVSVDELIKSGYLKPDKELSECSCVYTYYVDCESGCVMDPQTGSSMNHQYVVLTKKSVGLTAQMDDGVGGITDFTTDNDYLVNEVCDLISSDEYIGKYGPNEEDTCKCYVSPQSGSVLDITTTTGRSLDDNYSMCLVVNPNGGDVNNYLKYGAEEANWRVIGVYKINGDIFTKMITSEMIN